MRQFTKKRDIIRLGVTRFAFAFLTLQSLMEKKEELKKMVVDGEWESLSHVKTKRAKMQRQLAINRVFWNGVALCLRVFEPLVEVLCLVDGDVKSSMAFLYGELIKTKKELKDAFGNVEKSYKDVVAIVEKKIKGRVDSQLHLSAYMLNPYYCYVDDAIFMDPNITESFMSCVESFYHGDDDKEDRVVNQELIKFQNIEGPFGNKLARSCQNFNYKPASWWRLYGGQTPDLQKMALRPLSLTSSSSDCERN